MCVDLSPLCAKTNQETKSLLHGTFRDGALQSYAIVLSKGFVRRQRRLSMGRDIHKHALLPSLAPHFLSATHSEEDLYTP